MKLKSLLTTTAAVVLIGAASLTNCSGSTEFELKENVNGSTFLKTSHTNQVAYYNGASQYVFKPGLEELYLEKAPMIYHYNPETGGTNILGAVVSGLLPEGCNARLPQAVCSLPSNQVQLFLVAQEAEVGADEYYPVYHPHFAIFPAGFGTVPSKTVTGTVRLVDSDSETIVLQKFDDVRSVVNPDPCVVDATALPAISRVTNKQISLADDAFAPLGIGELYPSQSDSFWSCAQFNRDGADKAVVGLHWVLSGTQRHVLHQEFTDIGLDTPLTQTAFLKRLQALGRTDEFDGHGHIPKLLSLFSNEFTLATDAGCPFALTGFSGAEQTHRWTGETKASITVPLDSPDYARPKKITFFNTQGLLDVHAEQILNVFLNGGALKTYKYTGALNDHNVEVDIPDDGSDEAKIEFDIPNASPIPTDGRNLGVLFRGFNFTY